MATTRIIFYGWGVWLAEVLSATRCKVWLAKPRGDAFPQDDRFDFDLTKTPLAEARGSRNWANVEVDDHNDQVNGGATGFGGMYPWPDTAHGIYVAEGRHAAIVAANAGLWPPMLAGEVIDEYRLQAVLMIDVDDAGGVTARRYHGFYATMLDKIDATQGRFLVWQAEGGKDPANARRFVLKFADLDWQEASPLSTVRKAGDSGALFLRWKAASEAKPDSQTFHNALLDTSAQVGIESPKLPLGLGGRFDYYFDPEQPHVP